MTVNNAGEKESELMYFKRKRLGELLKERKRISHEDLEKVLEEQARGKTAVRLGELLLQRELLSKDDLVSALEEVTQLRYLDARFATVEKEVLSLIPRAVASRCKVLPVLHEGKRITAIMAEPQNLRLLDELRFLSGMEISPRLGFVSEIDAAIEKWYGTTETAELKPPTSSDSISINTGSADRHPEKDGNRVSRKWWLIPTGVLGLFFIWWLASAISQAGRLSDTAVAEFHRLMNAGDFEVIYSQADGAFQQSGKKEEILKFFADLRNKLGNAGASSRSEIELRTGTDGTFVTVSYRTTYERGIAHETFVWRKTIYGGLILVSYQVQSNAFTIQ